MNNTMKTRLVIILTFAFAFSFTSCMQSPKGEKASTSDVFEISDYKIGVETPISIDKSTIEWLGTKPTGTHFGTIGVSEGKVYLKDGKLLGGFFTFNMNDIVVLDIDNPGMNQNLVGHLKSPDFFSVDSFPTATFEFSRITPLENGESFNDNLQTTHLVEGNLTLKGITKGISFNTMIKIDGNSIVAKTPQFIINRTNWNVNYGSKSIFASLKDNFIHDEVGIKISISN